MKSKFFLVCALLIGVCSAFTAIKSPSPTLQNTYEFRGLPGQENDPTKYWLIDGTPGHVALHDCGGAQQVICRIVADPNSSNSDYPDLSVGNPIEMPVQYDAEFKPGE